MKNLIDQNYRTDIQGLRGLAVLAVVLYHAGNLLPGGFMGVDVFFVISGFVITWSILREYALNGRVSLRSFYWKRFKRLAPALSIVVTFTTLVALIIQSPFGPIQTTALTAAASMFSLSNIYLKAEMDDYFGRAAELNPLLHTWSLSVEEQFYAFFPAMFVIGLLITRRSRIGVTGLILLVSLVSFALAVIQSTSFEDPWLSFYSPIVRAWEFGVGALLAILLSSTSVILRKSLAHSLYFLGLAMLVFSFSAIIASDSLPSVITLLPVVGTALLILVGNQGIHPRVNILTTVPMAKLGDLSYSIYLWHWPFIVFTRVLLPDSGGLIYVSVLLSTVAAIASWHFVEVPIRQSQNLPNRKSITLTGIVMILPLLTSSAVWSTAQSVGGYAQDLPIGYELDCHGPGKTSEELQICRFSGHDDDSAKTTYLVGDSHAAHFSSGLLEFSRVSGQSLQIITASACPFWVSSNSEAVGLVSTECASWQEKVMQHLRSAPPGVVVIGGYWELHMERLGGPNGSTAKAGVDIQSVLRKNLNETVEALGEAGHIVVLVQDVPNWDIEPDVGCRLGVKIEDCGTNMTIGEFLESQKVYRDTIEIVGQESQFVSVLDLTPKFCPNGICSTSSNGILMFRDRHHITNAFSGTLSKVWLQGVH